MPGSRRAVTPGMPRAAGPTRTKPFPFATQPFATQPFATQPFATQPFATQPPLVTRPLMSQPLVTRPPTRSSMTQPLAAQPPLSQWRPTRLPKRPAPRGLRPAALPARFRGGFRDCGGRSRGLGRAAPETSGGRLRRLPAGGSGEFPRGAPATSGAAGGISAVTGSRPRTSAGAPGTGLVHSVAGREYVSEAVQSCREACTNMLDVGGRAVLATSQIEELWTAITPFSLIPLGQRRLQPRLAGHRGGRCCAEPRLA